MPQLIKIREDLPPLEFPDGMTDDQIHAAIQKEYGPKSTNDQVKNLLNEVKNEGNVNFDNRLVALGRGFTDIGEGIKQKYLQAKEGLGYAPEGTSDQYQKQVDAERDFYNTTPAGQDKYAQAARVAANTLPWMALPGGVAGSIAKRMLTGGAASTAMGAAQYNSENGPGMAENMIWSGLLGSGMTGLMGLGTKGVNASTGNAGTPAQQAVIKAGEKHNVPVYTPDVSDNPFVKGTSYTLQNMPSIPGLSMVPDRKAQMIASGNAAGKVTDDLYQNMVNTPYGGRTGMQRIQNAANDRFSPRSDAANQVLQSMSNAGDDYNRVIQTSGNANLLRARLIADKKYDKVSKVADQFGSVPNPYTMESIDSAIKAASDDVLPNESLIKQLQTMQRNFGKKMNYSQMRNARASVGSLITDFHKGANAAIGEKGSGLLQTIKKSVGMDMDKFAQANGPQLKTVWKNADTFYKDAVTPAKDRLLASSLTNKDPDEIYKQWVKTGDRKDRATRFYSALDNKGKSAIRYGLVNDAYKAATNQDGLFSPGAFASEIRKYTGAKDSFFKGKDKTELDGFTNLMTHVRQSFETMSKPRTGERNIPWLAGLGALGAGGAYMGGMVSGGSVLGGLAGIAGVKKLMTSKWGRDYLIAASKLKAGTPAMQSLAETLSRLVQRTGVSGALNAVNQ